MRRREFIAGLGSAAVWPLVAQGQRRRPQAKIGVLWHAGSEREEAPFLTALRQGLADRGYVEGDNLSLDNRFAAEQYDRFNQLAAELVDSKVDVLVAVSPAAAAAAKRATSTVPVVFVVVPDPVRSKLVDSLAHPGGNVTGLSNLVVDLSAKRLQLFKDAVPDLSRIALLVNVGDPDIARRTVNEVQEAAARLLLTVRPTDVEKPSDLDTAFSTLDRQQVDGVMTTLDAMMFNERKHIADLALTRHLPALVHNREMVQAGGLISYGPSFPDLFRRAADYVDKIITGAKPSELPVEQPTKFELVINGKTAKVTWPHNSAALLARADEVIE